jgi:succinate-semialdehyde dehydrogenase/glutarate-semialdehyde dehydrogenase
VNLLISKSLQANLLGGQWILAENSVAPIKVNNPATAETIGLIPVTDPQKINNCVETNRKAGRLWHQTTAAHKATCLLAWADKVSEQTRELAEIITLENGKPIQEAIAEVKYTESFIRWFAEEARRIRGEIIAANSSNTQIHVTSEPVGLCGLITPWNFPAAMLGRKLAAALAAGCGAICKPAEETPFSAVKLIQLAIDAGIPAELVSIVTGVPEQIGQVLCKDSRIRKISFTGSSQVGRILMAQSATNLKRLSLELGGNAPFIVFEDADTDAAVNGIIASKFRNAGQTCIASNRILVHESLLNEVLAKLSQMVDALVVGDGFDPQTDIGPLISKRAVVNYHSLIQDALSRGACKHTDISNNQNGQFVDPVILTGVTPEMRIWKEEIFAPIIGIRVFNSDEEALRMANDTEAGLAAYFYSQNAARIQRFSELLAFGMVGINTGRISMAQVPFGGIKQSGFGREGSHHGIHEYLQLKYKCIQT